MKLVVFFLLVILTLGCQAHINLGTCVLQCDRDDDESPRVNSHQQSNRFQETTWNQRVTGSKESEINQGHMGFKDDRETMEYKGDRERMGYKGDRERMESVDGRNEMETEIDWENMRSKGDKDDQSPMRSATEPGGMGTKGDRGPMGPKGDPPEECYCHDTEELKRTMFPRSCSDFLSGSGVDKSGVYTIYPYGEGDLTHLRVYCDLKTDGGGWMVFQKRMDGSVDFFQNFNDYVRGFGSLAGEFWLGLEAIHKLTKDGGYQLRIDMEDFENQTRYALYNDFVVGAGRDYTLTFGDYNGTAGDALQSARFSAKDRDQDGNSGGSCSKDFKGGWWYANCHRANPNGLYLGGVHKSFADGIEWSPWRGQRYSLKRMEMKIKKM